MWVTENDKYILLIVNDHDCMVTFEYLRVGGLDLWHWKLFRLCCNCLALPFFQNGVLLLQFPVAH